MIWFYNYTLCLFQISMFTGLAGFCFSMFGKPLYAAFCLLVSGFCNIFDGRIVEKKKRIGDRPDYLIKFDSIFEFVIFGLAPILVIIILKPTHELTNLICVGYYILGLLRLLFVTANDEISIFYDRVVPIILIILLLPLAYYINDNTDDKSFIMAISSVGILATLLASLITIPKIKKYCDGANLGNVWYPNRPFYGSPTQFIVDRKTFEIRKCDLSKSQNYLYRTRLGRFFLKFIARRWIANVTGIYMNSRLSLRKIPKFVKENNIDTSIYELDNIKCYNDFFTRKIRDGVRPIDSNPNRLISPCDSKLQVFRINKDSLFEIKQSLYKVSDLVDDENLAKEYMNGYCMIFRLTVDDYHRYCYVDSGTKSKNKYIKGELHTVNPIALEKYNIYKRNCREVTILNTDHFGKICHVEVGAMMIGKIKNHHEEYTFKKGEEKGMFLFGGSTIVLLCKNNIEIDADIMKNSLAGNETTVKYGEGIASLIKEG